VRLRRAVAFGACALALGSAPTRAGESELCTTVEGAPAATSEPLVVGMRRQMEARDAAGLRKFLDTGQALLLVGGNPVQVLERRPEQGLVKVRRGERQLPFWTVASGIACTAKP
jgi:hypothetical protein